MFRCTFDLCSVRYQLMFRNQSLAGSSYSPQSDSSHHRLPVIIGCVRLHASNIAAETVVIDVHGMFTDAYSTAACSLSELAEGLKIRICDLVMSRVIFRTGGVRIYYC
jgi:hypothetical protein